LIYALKKIFKKIDFQISFCFIFFYGKFLSRPKKFL